MMLLSKFTYFAFMGIIFFVLEARLMVGKRTLNPYVEVRILRPQPDNILPGDVMRLELTRKGHVTLIT